MLPEVAYGKVYNRAHLFLNTLETAYSGHVCLGQIDHFEWMIIITKIIVPSLVLMQIIIQLAFYLFRAWI